MQLSARKDTRALHESLASGEIRFIKGRLKFQQNGQEQDAVPFPSIICVMGPDINPTMRIVNRESLK